MTNEELKALGEKIGNRTATEEERLQFMSEINSTVASLGADLAKANSHNKES